MIWPVVLGTGVLLAAASREAHWQRELGTLEVVTGQQIADLEDDVADLEYQLAAQRRAENRRIRAAVEKCNYWANCLVRATAARLLPYRVCTPPTI